MAAAIFADYWSARPADVALTYVGRSSCADCHRAEVDAFHGSHHDLAMEPATEATVKGDFGDATLEHHGITSRMFRDGDRFMVHTEGPTGELQDFEVKYVFGTEPLQQYMVEFDRHEGLQDHELPRLQVLRISWDTVGQRWFYLSPPDVQDKLAPDDPLHWTGIAQRWQTMCAECHSTNLQTNFDPASGHYRTTFTEIDVSCEACHGPASLHVELASAPSLFWDRRHGYGLAQLKGKDPEPQLQTCAPCHSRRSLLTDDFCPGDPFSEHFQLELLGEDTYHADGQIKDEVYVYGSFLQSRMYHQGIRCTDCHDPHSLQLKFPGNQLCTSCHQHSAGKYDVPAHHHHAPGTAGALCVNCHMPETTYMDVDPRRDHSLRVPRPDLSVTLGTPNACSGCHVRDRIDRVDQPLRAGLNEYADWLAAASDHQQIAEIIAETDRWCDEACDRWYGAERQRPAHFAEAVVAFRRGDPQADQQLLALARQPNTQTPMIARASIVGELALAGNPQSVPLALEILKRGPDEQPLVRAAAVNALIQAADATLLRRTLLPLLQDESRLVRTEAARVLTISGAYQSLSGTEQARVDQVLKEIREALDLISDRSGSHLSWGLLSESRGRFDEAIEAYETGMAVEPTVAGPRSNLASLLERLAAQAPPEQRSAVLQRVQGLRREELPLLARDAGLAPDNAAVQYRYGLALYLTGDLDQAMSQLERAVELAPQEAAFRQARDLLRERLERE